MKTFSRSYLSSSSSRREALGLMGSFLVFLMGIPGHSEPMMDSAKHMARQLIRLILVFLGLATPATQVSNVIQAPPAATAVHVKPKFHRAVVKAEPVDPNSMLLRRDPILHRFTYLFDGKATFQGQPCANGSVLVRLVSGDRSVAKGAVTNADGSYSLEVSIDAQNMSPVDWTIEAYTADFKKVELAGRRIVQRIEEQEKTPIIVTNPVDFVVSSSK